MPLHKSVYSFNSPLLFNSHSTPYSDQHNKETWREEKGIKLWILTFWYVWSYAKMKNTSFWMRSQIIRQLRVCPLKESRSCNTPEQWALLMPRSWVSKYPNLQKQKPGLFREMRWGREKYRVSLEHLEPESEKVLKDGWGHVKKIQEPAKGIPTVKFRTIWATERIMTVMNHSTKNPWVHSDTQNKKKNKNLWVLGGEREGKDFITKNAN